jgi:Trk-type K+ transport system membrane component
MAILNNTDNTASAANTPLYWTIFHTISAYNNCGYSLQRDSFAR